MATFEPLVTVTGLASMPLDDLTSDEAAAYAEYYRALSEAYDRLEEELARAEEALPALRAPQLQVDYARVEQQYRLLIPALLDGSRN